MAAGLDRVQPDRSAAIPGPAWAAIPGRALAAIPGQAEAEDAADPGRDAAGPESAARLPAAIQWAVLLNPEDERLGVMVAQEVSVILDQVRLGFLVNLDRVCRGFLAIPGQVRLGFLGRSGEWASRDSGARSGGLVYLECRQLEGRNNTRLKCGLMPYGFCFGDLRRGRASRHYESMLFLKIL